MKKNDPCLKYFYVLSDLLLHSIRNQQTNISKSLSDFFYTEFGKVRDKFTNEPVIYPDIYYEVVYKSIEELAILKEKRNYLLEQGTSGEKWLLGDLQGKEISDRTFFWMWKNLLLGIQYQQDDLIVNHWETCHQYYDYSLPYIQQEYDYSARTIQISNKEAVDKRLAERQKFIEFHYALGGLLTYKERYECIKRLFSYTQSQPPNYELLPDSMFEIFDFYFTVRSLYDRRFVWISHQYPFPELSGINANNVIKKWICSYMAILFLRQYTIVPYLMTIRPFDFPQAPKTQGEIKEWINGLDFFKKLVGDHLKNEKLLKALNLDFITPEWCEQNEKPYPIFFIDTFKENLENVYHTNALNLPISKERVKKFEDSTKTIIESTIDKFNTLNNKTLITDDKSDKWYVNGQRELQSKDAFSESPEVHYINFDVFLASSVSKSLYEGLGETFFYKRTKSYLLKDVDLFKAIDRLEIDDRFAIINFGMNLDNYIKHIVVPGLSKEKYRNVNIYSFGGSQVARKSMFILKKSDFPNISTKQISKEIIEKYSLNKISSKIELYASVIDLNNSTKEVYNESKRDKSDDDMKKSVLLNIIISTEFKWKKNIEVIQLRQYSEFIQEGIVNKLDDVNPFDQRNRS